MELDKNSIAMELERVLSAEGAEGFIEGMYRCFMMMAGDAGYRELVLVELKNAEESGIFDAKVCEDFKDWFSKVPEIGGSLSPYKRFDWFGMVPKDGGSVPLYEDFKTLMMSSRDFMLLCFYLMQSIVLEAYQLNLKSSDGLVLTIGKSAATAKSVVLNDLVDCTGGRDEIPVAVVHSRALSPVIEFCEMAHGFDEGLRNLVYGYKDQVTKFVNSNHAKFKELYHAADFLDIQDLLDLTSWAVGDTMGNERGPEEISEWYGNRSISQALSSLVNGDSSMKKWYGNWPKPQIGQYDPWAFAGENAHLDQGENPWAFVGEDAHLDQGQGEIPWAFA